MTSRRRPWLAGVANLLVPRSGNVYAGRPLRGVGVCVAAIACGVSALFGALYAPSFLSDLLLAFPLFTWSAIVTDAVVVARRAGPYQLRRFNR
jgi:hypothetical protein